MKDPNQKTAEKVKSTFLDIIYREWLNTPLQGWANKSPLQIINEGNGDMLIDILNKASEELKIERNKNGTDSSSPKKSSGKERISR